ncbi:SSS family transporter [Dysgonomonas sp. PH5-45]|uniref:sodium:solute symporter n=1 Tax=unclassified Dysgonomonas TaxID=2630389 RepID=UPI0024749D40|nr:MULTISPECIES: sodium:solute symporter [unclassified Dysgonomonas]MDH6354784.1 SSS family transporter [Dysgonomonas sp. PH5-45]MDH6387683.1 SSS family transporter [Dysgonomonas sp. PH5-37]
MVGTSILIIIAVYFGLLYTISYFIGRRHTDNDAFFLGNRKSPWWLVAIAMVGSSISGVTFVSVPGQVGVLDMTYMQMVLGFFVGYLIVAYVLLPLYYKLNLTTIYEYLHKRLGFQSYRTGASFFILSKVVGAAVRLYLAVMILQALVFARWGVPFWVTVTGVLLLIWIYTHKSGIKTILWTDLLQTSCMIGALILIIWQVVTQMDLSFGEAVATIADSKHARIFVFDDWGSKQNFVKQFLSGIFITIVMTGLDQSMMQKNLTCKNPKDAQKNMVSYGFAFIPINFLFLCLGILLLAFATQKGITLPEKTDQILPMLATEYLGLPVLIFFTIGIIAAAFASSDSALAALTTSVCVDLLDIGKKNEEEAKRIRKRVHIGMSVVFIFAILIINALNSTNVLDAIYTSASYTYGPLLGLFAFGLFTRRATKDRFVPYICVASPFLCFGITLLLEHFYGYTMGYELLMMNGFLTFAGLMAMSSKQRTAKLKL